MYVCLCEAVYIISLSPDLRLFQNKSTEKPTFCYPANTRFNVGSVVVYYLRRRRNIKPTLGQHLVYVMG